VSIQDWVFHLLTTERAIEEALTETSVPAEESRPKRFNFLRRTHPTASAHEDLPALKQKLDASYQEFMVSCLLWMAAFPIEIVDRTLLCSPYQRK
jgi:hypothetical protein